MNPLRTVQYPVERTGLRAEQIYELCRQQVFPHVRVGRRVLFDPEAIEVWIKSGGQALPGGWRREPE